ncbi:lipoprotein [Klebsiella pneumoniae]|nr:lipoprotein [Klebsiella pneumoniae]
MLLRFRVLPLVFVISLLSGCGLASKAFYSAGDKLFQPGDDAVASMQTYSVAQFLQPFTLNPAKASSDYLGKWVKVRGGDCRHSSEERYRRQLLFYRDHAR